MKDRRICLDDDILMSDYRDLQQENEELLKYKNAWEELKQEKLVKNYLLEYMQELEQKYKIGDKNE